MSSTLAPAAPTAGTATPPRRRPLRPAPFGRRLAVGALVAGSVLNAAQALLARAAGTSGGTTAEWLAAADEQPFLVSASVVSGTLGACLLLLVFQAVAHLVRRSSPRLAAAGSALTFAGALGFVAMHGAMLAQLAAVGVDDRAGVVAAFEAVESSPVGLVVLVPFLLGLFGGLLCLIVALLRTAGVPRWIPAVWGLFLVLDLFAQQAVPVDPHVLFVAGALGLAVLIGRRSDDAWLSGSADDAVVAP